MAFSYLFQRHCDHFLDSDAKRRCSEIWSTNLLAILVLIYKEPCFLMPVVASLVPVQFVQPFGFRLSGCLARKDLCYHNIFCGMCGQVVGSQYREDLLSGLVGLAHVYLVTVTFFSRQRKITCTDLFKFTLARPHHWTAQTILPKMRAPEAHGDKVDFLHLTLRMR